MSELMRAAIPAEGRLLLRVRREHEYQAHAAMLRRVLNECAPDVKVTTRSARAAGDGRTLRGIPAVGRNVGGAISGTRPDQVAAWTKGRNE